MNKCRAAFLVSAFASMTLLLAIAGCGGGVSLHAPELGDDGGIGVGQCTPLVCPPEAAWDPVGCACEPIASGTSPGNPGCSARCPAGTVLELLNGACGCVAVEPPPEELDASVDVTEIDAPVVTYYDVYPVPDAFPYTPDSSPCSFLPTNYCGPGYALDGCSCVQCSSSSCPSGQTPGAGCNGCIACSSKCPQGFVFGAGCSCVPTGTVQPAIDGGGPTCTLGGYNTCGAGQWCSLGTCPDGQTQYGCYCDSQGHSTCQLECPTPPPCTIPGQGTCPYGSECLFGTCGSGSDSLLACSCYQNGQAYCSTVSCEAGVTLPDGGVTDGGGGVTCLLEGYVTCNAGSFCPVGTCPDNQTQYGCFCNADGTATCDLDCPPPAPCVIPGEGTCPSGTQCQYGTCNGTSGSILSCSCYAGNASCYTYSCAQGNGFDGG
jgi:hypothetical protein